MVQFNFDALDIEILNTLQMRFLLMMWLKICQSFGIERHFVLQEQTLDERISLLAIQGCLEDGKHEKSLDLQNELPHNVRIVV